MALKTVETKESVKAFVDAIEDDSKRKDVKALLSLITKITGNNPKLWGSIIGFGKYTYRRKNSKEDLEWFHLGVAPRKTAITLYVTCYLENEPLVQKLGKYKAGKGCLYIKKLDDIDMDVLTELVSKYKDHKWYS